MWQQLNEYYLFVRDNAAKHNAIESLNRFFLQVRRGAATFQGLTDSTMIRGEAYHFSRLGRMIERADKTSRILDVKYFILLRSLNEVGSPIDHIQWSAVLRSASAFEMYRKVYGQISPFRVVDFLLFNHDFPRAVRFCLDQARESLHAISGTPRDQVRSDVERRLGSLCSDLTYTQADKVIKAGLHEYLDDLQNRLNEVGKAIHQTYFSRKVPLANTVDHHRRGADNPSVFTPEKPPIESGSRNLSQTQSS